MSRPLRNTALVLLSLAAIFAVSACGDSNTRMTTGSYAGESAPEAPYLNVGNLIYQVQYSRRLNPYSKEDAAYLSGLPAKERELKPGELWLGVFMQVYNHTSKPHLATLDYTLTDTENNVFRPATPVESNPFAYKEIDVPPNGQLPETGSIADAGPTQAMVLLFKIPTATYDNRPVTLKIVNLEEPSQSASAILDF